MQLSPQSTCHLLKRVIYRILLAVEKERRYTNIFHFCFLNYIKFTCKPITTDKCARSMWKAVVQRQRWKCRLEWTLHSGITFDCESIKCSCAYSNNWIRNDVIISEQESTFERKGQKMHCSLAEICIGTANEVYVQWITIFAHNYFVIALAKPLWSASNVERAFEYAVSCNKVQWYLTILHSSSKYNKSLQ